MVANLIRNPIMRLLRLRSDEPYGDVDLTGKVSEYLTSFRPFYISQSMSWAESLYGALDSSLAFSSSFSNLYYGQSDEDWSNQISSLYRRTLKTINLPTKELQQTLQLLNVRAIFLLVRSELEE